MGLETNSSSSRVLPYTAACTTCEA
jgi:hypothetical protein